MTPDKDTTPPHPQSSHPSKRSLGCLLGAIALLSALVVVLDRPLFRVCNASLSWWTPWALFWALLNHRAEKVLNMVAMGAMLVAGYLITKDKRAYVINLALAIIVLEIGIFVLLAVFQWGLHIHRPSPSLVIQGTDFIDLDQLWHLWFGPRLPTQNVRVIKTTSSSCFPSGHAFVITYFFLVGWNVLPRIMRPWLILLTVPLSIARVFSGGHWPSDIVASAVLSCGAYSIFVTLRNHLLPRCGGTLKKSRS